MAGDIDGDGAVVFDDDAVSVNAGPDFEIAPPARGPQECRGCAFATAIADVEIKQAETLLVGAVEVIILDPGVG